MVKYRLTLIDILDPSNESGDKKYRKASISHGLNSNLNNSIYDILPPLTSSPSRIFRERQKSMSGTLNRENSAKHDYVLQFGYEDSDARKKSVPLHPQSSMEEFREFQSSITHPAVQLGMLVNYNEQHAAIADGGPLHSTAPLPSTHPSPLSNIFTLLCDEVLTALSDIETSAEDLSVWKDDFLKQSIPANVKISLALSFSRLIRR